MSEESVDDVFSDLSLIDTEECVTAVRRDLCSRCKRPMTVCWCPHLPSCKLTTRTRVVILQHPNEQKRNVRTAPMLEAALQNCHIVRGRHFSKHPLLQEVYADEVNTFVLYPGPQAVDVSDLSKGRSYNLIVIDGTWPQAKSLYFANKELHNLKKVKITPTHPSYYVVRTQPHSECLSTVESVALAMSWLEENPDLEKILVRPLVAMCAFQINHGAELHDSKEEQILSGTFKKKIPKKIENRIRECKDFRNLLMA